MLSVIGRSLLLGQTSRASLLDERQLLLPCQRMNVPQVPTTAAVCLLEVLPVRRGEAWISTCPHGYTPSALPQHTLGALSHPS